MILSKKSNTRLLLEQIIVAIFFLYMEWYKQIWGNSPVILYGTVSTLTLFVFIRMLHERYFRVGAIPSLLKMLILYLFYSFLGIFVARDKELFVSSLVTYASFVIVCFNCWYISFKLGNHDWIYRIFRLVSGICAVQVVFWGQPYYNGVVVTTMSSINNPNTLGLILLIGIFSFSIGINLKGLRSFIVAMAANIMMLYGIVLSGSRKCFLAAVPVFVFWLFTYVRAMIKKKEIKQLLIALGCIGVGLILCVSYYNHFFQSTASFERLTILFQGEGTSTRKELYQEAVEYFQTSPIIGIGLDQFRVWSPYDFYSHSSYAEVLACGGLIGIVIFFVPLMRCLRACIGQAVCKSTYENMYRIRMVVLLFICELFIGVGQIYIYSVIHMLVLMLISMEQEANKREISVVTK